MCSENRQTRLRVKGRAFVRSRAARRNGRINQQPSIDSSTRPLNTSTDSNSNPATPPAFPSLRNTRTSPNSTCITKPRVNRELVAIALRTVELIRTNRELQIRMADLRRETTEFIIDVMNNPENAAAKAHMIAAQNRLANQGKSTTDTNAEEKAPSKNFKAQSIDPNTFS